MKGLESADGIAYALGQGGSGFPYGFIAIKHLSFNLGGGFSNIFPMLTRIPGEMIPFDYIIFLKWVGSVHNW